MWKNTLFLSLLVLLLLSPLSWCFAEEPPLTAEELQGLPNETLIEIILELDKALTTKDQELLRIETAWNSAETQLNNDRELLKKDEELLNGREMRLNVQESLFEESLKLQREIKRKNLIEKVVIGIGSFFGGYFLNDVIP